MSIRKVLASAVLMILGPSLLPSAPLPADTAETVRLAQARLEAAQEAYRRHAEVQKEGPYDPELLYIWSKRLLEGQREVARNKEEEVAALQAHLERMVKVQATFKQRLEGIPRKSWPPNKVAEEAAVQFYFAEAELWLARTKHTK